MKIHYAQTVEEKAAGVSIFSEEEFSNSAMVFTSIGPRAHFHMTTVDYPIGIMSLDDDGRVLDKAVMAARVGTYTTVEGTNNVVELSMDLYDKYQPGDRFF